MPDFFVILAALLGLIGTTVSILVGYGTIRQRRNEPDEKRWADWEKWRGKTDEHLVAIDDKLDNDNRRLKRMDEETVKNSEFQRLMLKSIKGIIEATAPGTTNEDMRRVSAEIDEFLIKR